MYLCLSHFHSFDFHYFIACECCLLILFLPCFYCAIDCKCIAHVSFHLKHELLTFFILMFYVQRVSYLKVSFSLSCCFSNTFQYVFHPLYSNISDVLTDLVSYIKHCTTYSPNIQSLYPWTRILSCFILFVFISSFLFYLLLTSYLQFYQHFQSSKKSHILSGPKVCKDQAMYLTFVWIITSSHPFLKM